MSQNGKKSNVSMACPLRFGQPCNLCHPDAHNGPQDCPTVAIVMDDEELRAELHQRRQQYLLNNRA